MRLAEPVPDLIQLEKIEVSGNEPMTSWLMNTYAIGNKLDGISSG